MITDADKAAVVKATLDHPQGLFGLIERDGYFNTKVPYPKKEDFPTKINCKECGHEHENDEGIANYKEAMRNYRDDHNRLQNLFRYVAIVDCGLKDNPKADKAYSMAWDRGHSSGYYEVLQNLEDLSELIK